MSCHVMSCHVMSCHVMSCHGTSEHLRSRIKFHKERNMMHCIIDQVYRITLPYQEHVDL